MNVRPWRMTMLASCKYPTSDLELGLQAVQVDGPSFLPIARGILRVWHVSSRR